MYLIDRNLFLKSSNEIEVGPTKNKLKTKYYETDAGNGMLI